jgi:hypothetical protein
VFSDGPPLQREKKITDETRKQHSCQRWQHTCKCTPGQGHQVQGVQKELVQVIFCCIHVLDILHSLAITPPHTQNTHHTYTHTRTGAGKTKKAWWERGIKQVTAAAPLWDPWDQNPKLQLTTAESWTRDQLIGDWRHQAALAHTAAQSALRSQDILHSSFRAPWDPQGVGVGVGAVRIALERPRTANPAGRPPPPPIYHPALPTSKQRPKSASVSGHGRHFSAVADGGASVWQDAPEVAEEHQYGKTCRPSASERLSEGGGEGRGWTAQRRAGFQSQLDEDLDASVASFIKDDTSEAEFGGAECSPASPALNAADAADAALCVPREVVKLQRLCAEKDTLIRELEAEVLRLDSALGEHMPEQRGICAGCLLPVLDQPRTKNQQGDYVHNQCAAVGGAQGEENSSYLMLAASLDARGSPQQAPCANDSLEAWRKRSAAGGGSAGMLLERDRVLELEEEMRMLVVELVEERKARRLEATRADEAERR